MVHWRQSTGCSIWAAFFYSQDLNSVAAESSGTCFAAVDNALPYHIRRNIYHTVGRALHMVVLF